MEPGFSKRLQTSLPRARTLGAHKFERGHRPWLSGVFTSLHTVAAGFKKRRLRASFFSEIRSAGEIFLRNMKYVPFGTCEGKRLALTAPWLYTRNRPFGRSERPFFCILQINQDPKGNQRIPYGILQERSKLSLEYPKLRFHNGNRLIEKDWAFLPFAFGSDPDPLSDPEFFDTSFITVTIIQYAEIAYWLLCENRMKSKRNKNRNQPFRTSERLVL